MIEKYIEILNGIGESMHFGATTSLAIAEGIAVASLLVVGLLLYFLARFIVSKTVYVLIKKTPSKYDDLLIKNKVFVRICLLIPAILINYYIKDAMPDFPDAAAIIIKITKKAVTPVIIYNLLLFYITKLSVTKRLWFITLHFFFEPGPQTDACIS